MKTVHHQGFLMGDSICDKDVGGLASGNYDLAIISSSWDRRCLSIVEGKDFHARNGIILLYEVRDAQRLRDRHDKILLEYIKSHSDETSIVSGRSVDIEKLWQRLLSEITNVSNKIGGPLSVFLDLSTFSRFYALAILATCFSHGIAEDITIFYAEGVYNEKDIRSHDIAFSLGRWRSIRIPSLEGTYDPGKQKYYLVSVGFEGSKTLQVISREDPDRISILFPNPGFLPNYVERTEGANKILKQRFKVPDDQIINVNAGNAIEVWKVLEEAKVERAEKENIYYLCCGTKPHALGLALRALCLGYPAVLYRAPTEHKVVDVRPNGTFWKFHIRDLSAFPRSK